jgi:hypothetical protein
MVVHNSFKITGVGMKYRGARTTVLGRAAEIPCVVTQKEWRRPGLRKLPIAATAQGKPAIHGDDGNCVGKGDTISCLS